jgi:hypothetical protein
MPLAPDPDFMECPADIRHSLLLELHLRRVMSHAHKSADKFGACLALKAMRIYDNRIGSSGYRRSARTNLCQMVFAGGQGKAGTYRYAKGYIAISDNVGRSVK